MELSCRVILYTLISTPHGLFQMRPIWWVYACWKACCLTIQRKWKWPGTCWMWDLNALPGQIPRAVATLCQNFLPKWQFIRPTYFTGQWTPTHIVAYKVKVLTLPEVRFDFFNSTILPDRFCWILLKFSSWLIIFPPPNSAKDFQQIKTPPSAVVPLLNDPSI